MGKGGAGLTQYLPFFPRAAVLATLTLPPHRSMDVGGSILLFLTTIHEVSAWKSQSQTKSSSTHHGPLVTFWGRGIGACFGGGWARAEGRLGGFEKNVCLWILWFSPNTVEGHHLTPLDCGLRRSELFPISTEYPKYRVAFCPLHYQPP